MRCKLVLGSTGVVLLGSLFYLMLLFNDDSATGHARAATTAQDAPTLTSQQLAAIQAINTLLLADDEPETLVLLYVNGDNNLAAAMQKYQLVQNIHQGAANPDITVRMVLDWPGMGNSRYYQVDRLGAANCDFRENFTCGPRYRDGQTVRSFPEDLGDPANLSKFIQDGITEVPNAQRIILALIGHGGGWSPNLRAGQPQGHDGKPNNGDAEMGGLLWDDSTESGIGNSLSTLDLRLALSNARASTSRKIDLLYLDACLMGMWEVAAEVQPEVQYLLASESWSWTSFAYAAHLQAVTPTASLEQIGAAWIKHEAAILKPIHHAYTYSLLDLTQMPTVTTRIDQLARQLEPLAPPLQDGHDKIRTAFEASDCFDSTGDALIKLKDPAGKNLDDYCDLGSFATHLQTAFPGNAELIDTAQAVREAISNTVRSNEFIGGVPGKHSNIPWNWRQLSGLSIYTPLGEDENKRGLYGQLQVAQATRWDEFLAAYWGAPVPALQGCLTDCALPDGPLTITYAVYLPVVQR